MKILPIQDVYRRKFERQAKIKELEYHAAGHCVHIGKISPGCLSCFIDDKYGRNTVAGYGCSLDCTYCASGAGGISQFSDKDAAKDFLRFKHDSEHLTKEASMDDYHPRRMSFSGGGEPLMHIDNIARYMALFHDIHKPLKKKPWYFLYTNGTFATKENLERLESLGIDEIRFHLGATNFSDTVYRNMAEAVKHIKTISVETPAWPLHREKLFSMLPRIEDIGVKHVNITEIEINKNNFTSISQAFPNGEICQCGELQMYDNGLVYDLMEEVVRQKYTFSVLDCNCFVKSIQRTPGKWLLHDPVDGLCAQ
jgi:pyruvate formate-lyase activating enzyme-like uncharacterized protein